MSREAISKILVEIPELENLPKSTQTLATYAEEGWTAHAIVDTLCSQNTRRNDGRVFCVLGGVPGLEQPFGFVPFHFGQNVVVQCGTGVGVA